MTYERGDWCVSTFNLADNIGDGEKETTAKTNEKS